MKIIAKTSSHFLMEVHIDEIANIQGYSSTYSEGFKKPEIGDEIKVSEFYELTKFIKEKKILSNIADIEKAANVIIKIAEKVMRLQS